MIENVLGLTAKEENDPDFAKLASIVCNQLAKTANAYLAKEKFPDIRTLEMRRLMMYINHR